MLMHTVLRDAIKPIENRRGGVTQDCEQLCDVLKVARYESLLLSADELHPPVFIRAIKPIQLSRFHKWNETRLNAGGAPVLFGVVSLALMIQ